jgi:hypothetical protein
MTTHLHLVPGSRMRGANPHSLNTSSWRGAQLSTGTTFYPRIHLESLMKIMMNLSRKDSNLAKIETEYISTSGIDHYRYISLLSDSFWDSEFLNVRHYLTETSVIRSVRPHGRRMRDENIILKWILLKFVFGTERCRIWTSN